MLGFFHHHSAILAEARRLVNAGLQLTRVSGGIEYGLEKLVEVYYDFQIWRNLHGALDYQYITTPAYNRDRGPVSVFGGRRHWEF